MLAASLVGAVAVLVALAGAPAHAILGGRAESHQMHMYMAGLVDLSSKTVFCGAALYTSKYVITSAQCVASRQAANLVVLLGDHDYSTGQDSPFANLHRIRRIIVHPQYNSTTLENDIALIELVNSGVINGIWSTLVQWSPSASANLTTVKVEGWGATSPEGPGSTKVQAVNLQVINNTDCARVTGSTIRASNFCTYTQGTGICRYDQGSPVTVGQDNIHRYLVGVVSYSRGCATNNLISPVVITKLDSYIPWIQQITGAG